MQGSKTGPGVHQNSFGELERPSNNRGLHKQGSWQERNTAAGVKIDDYLIIYASPIMKKTALLMVYPPFRTVVE